MSRNRIPYFDFYPSDFMHGVRGLSAQEVGVYTMLLCRIYEENGPVEFHIMRLSTYCGMRENTFTKVVDKLVDLGKLDLVDGMLSNHRAEVEISSRANKLKNNSKAGKASAEKRQQKQRLVSTNVQQPFNHTDTDTDNTSSLRSDVSVKSVDQEFENAFWPSYPRKVGKGQALKAFRTARKQVGLEPILAGLSRYAAARNGENPEYTKHASTWLNGQCWLDEDQPKFSPHRSDPPRRRGETATDIWRDELIERGVLRNEPDGHQSNILDVGFGGGHFESNVHPLRVAFAGSK